MRTVLPALLVIAVVACAASTRTMKLDNSPRVPGAQGEVTVRTAANDNLTVDVSVMHLAPPDKVTEGASTYVVWVKPLHGDPRPLNIGALMIDEDERGRLTTVTPMSDFTLMVTAERDKATTIPHGMEVLRTEVHGPNAGKGSASGTGSSGSTGSGSTWSEPEQQPADPPAYPGNNSGVPTSPDNGF